MIRMRRQASPTVIWKMFRYFASHGSGDWTEFRHVCMCNESIIKLLLPQTTKTSPGAGANKQQHEQRKQHQHHRLVAHFGATHPYHPPAPTCHPSEYQSNADFAARKRQHLLDAGANGGGGGGHGMLHCSLAALWNLWRFLMPKAMNVVAPVAKYEQHRGTSTSGNIEELSNRTALSGIMCRYFCCFSLLVFRIKQVMQLTCCFAQLHYTANNC